MTGLSGSCPNVQFTLNGRTILANEQTAFKGGCRALRNGSQVEVKGMLMSDGTVRAEKIDIND